MNVFLTARIKQTQNLKIINLNEGWKTAFEQGTEFGTMLVAKLVSVRSAIFQME